MATLLIYTTRLGGLSTRGSPPIEGRSQGKTSWETVVHIVHTLHHSCPWHVKLPCDRDPRHTAILTIETAEYRVQGYVGRHRKVATSGHPYLTPLGLIFWERITSPRGGPFSRVDHPRWDVPPFSQNCRWAPHCVFWWDVPPPQAGPKNLVGRPTSPFCRQDPWHQPKKKIVFLQLFLHCFCPLLVILDALS